MDNRTIERLECIMGDGSALESWLYKCIRKSDGRVCRVIKAALPDEVEEIEREVIRDLGRVHGGEWICEERIKVRK